MKVAQLDDNGFFVGVIELDESDINPVERGNYIIPGGCIKTLPPEFPHGSIAVWDGEKYEILSVIDPHPHEFSEIVDAIKESEEQIIRSKRDASLASTDWTQLADIPQETREKWADYRQSLRDIPQQESFPVEVSWPDHPDMGAR